MNDGTVKRWCIAGFFAIWGFGAVDHFIFDWSGKSPAVSIFAPVNESVWEHLKMGFWGMIVFSVVDFFPLKQRVRNYFIAKLSGVLLLEVTVLAVFYGYTGIMGRNILLLDIASFVAGIVLCQLLVYRILRTRQMGRPAAIFGLAGLVGVAVIFGLFTFHPPHLELFKDGRNGSFGIQQPK